MEYITHPYIFPDKLDKRTYQFSIALHALEGNTLVVIPTGLGKTAISLIVAASRLYTIGGKIVMLAPTKPLVEQHYRYFKGLLNLPGDRSNLYALFTGATPPEVRKTEWDAATVIFATPQVVKNDLIASRYSLKEVSLLIVDEAHRAVGNYAYVFLAGRYLETAREPLLIGMTASPGGNREKIADITENLHISIVEIRTDQDSDVSPYVHGKEFEVIHVDLPEQLRTALTDLFALVDDRLLQLKNAGFVVPDRPSLSIKTLQELSAQIQERIAGRDAAGYAAASVHAELMKLRHAIAMAESQGALVLKAYLNKLLAEGTTSGGSKASKRIAEDPRFVHLIELSSDWETECHPKVQILPDLVKTLLDEHPESKIIIFASYRQTVKMIVDLLNSQGLTAERFVGQVKKDSEEGLSQKKQIATIERFRSGEFKVLVATSVGEEGLDIPSTDVVIFYEPVPSEIRSIQRKGRTGRHGTGRIIVLVTRKTSDETFQFIAKNKEKSMAKEMQGFKAGIKRCVQVGLNDPSQAAPEREVREALYTGPTIVVDDRELVSKVTEYLSNAGALISLERLVYGDFLIGDRIVVERKTTRDFVDSLIDRNLLEQVKVMSLNSGKPVLIIEGSDLFSQRDIHPNAIRGALAAIAINMGVTIFQTFGAQDTAELLLVLAKREEEAGRPERGSIQKERYTSSADTQVAIIGSYPDIGLSFARTLLTAFGSVQAVINAEKQELMQVPGIGLKKAEQIYDLSRRSYP